MTFEFHGCSRCDGVNNRWPQRLCHDCHATYQRAWRKAHAPSVSKSQLKARRKSRRKFLRDTPQGRAISRAIAGVAKRRGQLTPQPCEVCGEPKAEMHHPDYADPLKVWWLCKPHHKAVHRLLGTAKAQKVAIDLRKPPSWVTKEPDIS